MVVICSLQVNDSRVTMAAAVSGMNQALSMDVEEVRFLEEAVARAKQEAFQMKRCLDKNRLTDALKHASAMLFELRTSSLSPKNYYELYMVVHDELNHLQAFLNDEFNKGNRMPELYELVQYAGNIIPRLYLVITVGVVFIKTNENSRREILHDLVEMCRGVQHPLRGLFLRNYLLQETKNVLPDTKPSAAELADREQRRQVLNSSNDPEQFAQNDAEQQQFHRHQNNANAADDNGSVEDSIDFILANFSEMNKLWVRMQHQGHSKDHTRREKERKDLRLLVGTNLVRLSNLESMDVVTYQRIVLPFILEQAVGCRDAIAQEYLLESIIQVFPDDFHLATLSTFLKACAQLQEQVNIKNILVAMIERLSSYVEREKAALGEDMPLFDIFRSAIATITTSGGNRHNMPAEDVVALNVSLVNLALKCYPRRLDLVDGVLQTLTGILDSMGYKATLSSNTHSAMPAAVTKEISRLLRIPVHKYPNIVTVLQLVNYRTLLSLLDYDAQKQVAAFIVDQTLEKNERITTPEDVERLLSLLPTLLRDNPRYPVESPGSNELFIEEQTGVGRLVHLLQHDYQQPSTPSDDAASSIQALDANFMLLKTIRKHFGTGGAVRAPYTLPAVTLKALQLVRGYEQYGIVGDADPQWEKKCQKIFAFCQQTVLALLKLELTSLAFTLLVETALAASSAKFSENETVAYEFMSLAFTTFEEEISDSKQKYTLLLYITGALERMECFGNDNHEPLRTQCALAAAKLLKKPDQCRAVLAVSNLFWSGRVKIADESAQNDSPTADNSNTKVQPLHDEKRVCDCIKRAVKFANQCMDAFVKMQLFVEVLSVCTSYYQRQVTIQDDIVRELNQKIATELRELDDCPDLPALNKQYLGVVQVLQQVRPQVVTPEQI